MSTVGESRPGRTCPADYIYAEGVLAAADDGEADVLYAAGNLYGNTEALRAIQRLARRERGRVRVVFAGDFHWFDVADDEFSEIAEGVAEFEALVGNVELELGRENPAAGCGCAYPAYVDDGVVERSNAIIDWLRDTARRHPVHRAWLKALPMFRAVRVAGLRVLLLHGDTRSLAGWAFAMEAMPHTPDSTLAAEFQRVGAHVIACSHTCLPFARCVGDAGRGSLLINNGAAGMPNFRNRQCGLVTRIATGTGIPSESLYGVQWGPLRCDAVAVDYDQEAWLRRFRRQWPKGSPADRSYAARLRKGPDHSLAKANLPAA